MCHVISPVLTLSSPLSPAIDTSLQDVGAEILDPDDMAKVLVLLPYGLTNCLFVLISSRTFLFVLWSTQHRSDYLTEQFYSNTVMNIQV